MVKERQGAGAARMRAQEDWKGAQKAPAAVRAAADTRAAAFTDVTVQLAGDAAEAAAPRSVRNCRAPPPCGGLATPSERDGRQPVAPPASVAAAVASPSSAVTAPPSGASRRWGGRRTGGRGAA